MKLRLTISSLFLTAALMMGQTKPAPAVPPGAPPVAKTASKTPKTPSKKSTTVVVHVNSSSETELQQVKGIGEATAKKIVAGRPWANLDDLVTKKAMNKGQYASIKGQLQL